MHCLTFTFGVDNLLLAQHWGWVYIGPMCILKQTKGHKVKALWICYKPRNSNWSNKRLILCNPSSPVRPVFTGSAVSTISISHYLTCSPNCIILSPSALSKSINLVYNSLSHGFLIRVPVILSDEPNSSSLHWDLMVPQQQTVSASWFYKGPPLKR